jgi:hypothetical protein
LVSTRCAPRCGNLEAGYAALQYWRLDGGQWQPADAAAFQHSAQPGVPTTVFVHGNLTDAADAVQEGMDLYGPLEQAAAGRPWRFVIWSWPSERMVRQLRADSQLKAGYSDTEAYYLARVVRDGVRGPLGLVGYSFGARAVTGSLELLAGGNVAGQPLPAATAPGTGPIRIMLIAAAMDDGSLVPGHGEGRGLGLADHVFVTQNACDPVLRFYPLMYGRGGPQALGFVGPWACGSYGAADGKIEAADLTCSVGRSHHWDQYRCAPEVLGSLAHYNFLDAPTTTGK